MEQEQSPAPAITGARPKPKEPTAKLEKPVSATHQEIKEASPEDVWEMHKNNIQYRKFDSDDVIKLRSNMIMAGLEHGKENVKIDTGMMQKVSIVLGVGSCTWFSDRIDEQIGVNPEIFNRRMGLEFRRIPVEMIDKMFLEVRKVNKSNYDKKELKKK